MRIHGTSPLLSLCMREIIARVRIGIASALKEMKGKNEEIVP